VTNTVMCAYHLHHLGRLAEGFDLLEKAWKRADEINQTYPAFVATNWTGNRLLDLLDPSEAALKFERESDQRRQIEAPDRRTGILSALASAYGRWGDLAQMRRLIDEHQLTSAEIATFEGRWERAEAALARPHASALSRQNSADRAVASLGLARLRSARGDPSAVDLLSETYSAALDGPATVMQMRSGPELAIELSLQRRGDEAGPVLERCREILAAGEDWRGRAGRVWLAEAAVAYAASRFEEGEAHFEQALDVFRHYSLPWDGAEAHQVRGRLLAALGRRHRAAASASFDQARQVYLGMDAAPQWLDALEAMRAAALGRFVQRGPSYPDGLSEREVEVLRLIAEGRSNREISEALVISVRTVERHITNIYAKIGARGKADATAYTLRHNLT
jgi:DNA-binding CsgD family transcriptional regulator/tetratricopeptide (TPR) repeat protein